MIHNISMATADDIIHIGDDVSIYTLYIYHWQLSLEIWLEKAIVSGHILSISSKLLLGTFPWPLYKEVVPY